MKTFDEFLAEGKKKDFKNALRYYYDLGGSTGDKHGVTNVGHLPPMTEDEFNNANGVKAIQRARKEEKQRREKAVKRIYKNYKKNKKEARVSLNNQVEEKVISYPMAQAATVYDSSGRPRRLEKGTAMAKRSPSSGGNGD